MKLLNLLKFEKALILVFVSSITITLIPTYKICANEIVSEISDNILEINDPQTGYSGKFETVYSDKVFINIILMNSMIAIV